MFADADDVPAGTQLDADLCIVGAGAAGITIARELRGSPLRVIVLESGDREYDGATQSLYEGSSVGLPYSQLHQPRLRYFGGTTNHWGGICRPLEEADFEARDNVPHSGWPLRLADLEPYYPRATRVCQLPSDDWDVGDWAREDRFSPIALDSEHIVSRVTQVVPRSRRRFGRNYADDLRRADNVTVYLHANVTAVDTDEAGNTATSVRVATLGGNHLSVRAGTFVLATGAIEVPRLLLVSNERWPAGLGNHHDLVGRFFAEHPRFIGGVLAPADPYTNIEFYDLHSVGDVILRGYLASSKQFQLDEGLMDLQIRPEPVYAGQLGGIIEADSVTSIKRLTRSLRRGDSVPGLGAHVATVLADLTTWQRVTIPGAPLPVPYPEVVTKLLRSSRREAEELLPALAGDIAARGYLEYLGAPLDHVLLSTRFEQAPNPDSRVLLTRQRDALGVPRVALDWRLSDVDRRNVVRTLEVLGTELGAAGLGRVRTLVDEDGLDWPEDLGGGSHLMGTTRMSDDPRRGVVDRDCRVHGMSNLFVAGSSVFPTPGGGTPTLTLVALALRLADHLAAVLR